MTTLHVGFRDICVHSLSIKAGIVDRKMFSRFYSSYNLKAKYFNFPFKPFNIRLSYAKDFHYSFIFSNLFFIFGRKTLVAIFSRLRSCTRSDLKKKRRAQYFDRSIIKRIVFFPTICFESER